MGKTYKSTRKSYIHTDEPKNLVSETAVSSYTLLDPLSFIANLLGISRIGQHEMQYIEASRSGIKKSALDKLISKLDITQEQMCKLLHMSTRTYQRLKKEDVLDIFSSEQAIEMAQVLAKAHSVFDSDSMVKQWLHSPLKSLRGTAPIDLLDTRFGSKMVLDTLGKIEHGVYA